MPWDTWQDDDDDEEADEEEDYSIFQVNVEHQRLDILFPVCFVVVLCFCASLFNKPSSYWCCLFGLLAG